MRKFIDSHVIINVVHLSGDGMGCQLHVKK